MIILYQLMTPNDVMTGDAKETDRFNRKFCLEKKKNQLRSETRKSSCVLRMFTGSSRQVVFDT